MRMPKNKNLKPDRALFNVDTIKITERGILLPCVAANTNYNH